LNALETCIICGDLISEHSKIELLVCNREFEAIATLEGAED